MTGKNDENEVEIDGVVYSYRCDICWQELDDTDIQFKPCRLCHLQVCLFCFNKHTNQKESYAKTCPKCREPIDMEAIVMQSQSNSVAKRLLSNKKEKTRDGHHAAANAKKKKRKKNKEPHHGHAHGHGASANHKHSHGAPPSHGHGHGAPPSHAAPSAVDVDEEVPKCDWKQYLKGRFISRDSIIVAPVIAKFNNEEAISDNFKAYGRITRINMWDDESAHIMYDKQYFVC